MDANTLAKSIVDQAIGEKPQRKAVQPAHAERGKRRADVLEPERRNEIAKKAAEARWKEK